MKKMSCMKVNGYSNYRKEVVNEESVRDFTLTFSCTPYTYESGVSGILSAYSRIKQEGLLVGVKKQGVVTVSLGIGTYTIEIESLKSHMKFQERNVITIAFWGTAGWCDLYVNGILSNRKQFPRHSNIQIPEGYCYVGKYVDGENWLEDSKYGVFHGELEILSYVNKYLNYAQVKSSYYKGESKVTVQNLYEGENYASDIYRPVYHLIPQGKWMNEPHAPFYYQGRYHIFYQANPHAPVWDNLCWGHLSSKDMVAWEDAGIALYPDVEGLDIDGCWSGSACIDAEGNPLLFYTAGNNKELPNQSVAVAVAEDVNDPLLREWRKEGVILQQGIGEGFFGEFRDPFVWRQDDCYHMLVGSGDAENGGGNALYYTSKDLKEFQYHGLFVEYDYEQGQEVGHVWELPVLLPLKNEHGEHDCDILLFCACQIENDVVETYYFLGKFDKGEEKFYKYHEIPRLVDLGCGVFTGPSGLVTPDGRSVVFTIAQGKRNPVDEYSAGWAHNGGMPIELWNCGGELRIAPIKEIQHYFKQLVAEYETESFYLKEPVFEVENLLENRLHVTVWGDSLELEVDWEDDGYLMSYHRPKQEWKVISKNTGEQISKMRNEIDLVSIGDEPIEIDCYFDHSLMEFYLNHRKGISLRSYSFCEKNKVVIKALGKSKVSVWKYEK